MLRMLHSATIDTFCQEKKKMVKQVNCIVGNAWMVSDLKEIELDDW